MLAQIGTTDITKWIQESTYSMNAKSVYEEWEDGNLHRHQQSIRNRVQGSFELVFTTNSDLDDFITLLNSNTENNLLTITVWVDNKNASSEHLMFYEFDGTSNRQINSSYVYKRFKMTLSER